MFLQFCFEWFPRGFELLDRFVAHPVTTGYIRRCPDVLECLGQPQATNFKLAGSFVMKAKINPIESYNRTLSDSVVPVRS